MADGTPQSEYAETIRTWEREAPLLRRILARVGIEGKLILGFLFLMMIALVGSGWMFWSASRDNVGKLTGEQAVELSQILSMACEPALVRKDTAELNRITRDLISHRGIAAVAVFDASGNAMALSSQDPDFLKNSDILSRLKYNLQHLMQVEHRWTESMGYFAEVTAPVLHSARGGASPASSVGARGDSLPAREKEVGARLVGYVSVSISSESERNLLKQVNWRLAIVGGLVFLLSLPLVSWLVHRIFFPIRELVEATHKIADGELDTQVAIYRPDVIGTLARSFNQMVNKVREQQEDLERANARLEDANHDLEERIGQRTAQLEMANKRLSSEIAEKEDFLRTISHDLSAPLRNISGMAAMLVMKYRDRFDEDIMHRLERIQKNVEVETDLIAELLELSRIKTRRQKMEPVDLDQVVRDLGEMFENDLKTRDIALVIDTPLPTATVEKARFRQVFQNLIDNAIKYMGEGQRREIHVGWNRRLTEAEFYVSDTGIGIDPQDLDKVFCIFRRGKNAAHNANGKGVGLASVKSIVEMYNGIIWVTSELGQGSTFRFTINGRFLPSDKAVQYPRMEAIAPAA